MNTENTICRVCGYKYENYLPRGENGNSPTYDFCDCCGIEFGNEDETLDGVRISREVWISKGMKWSSSYVKQPSDFTPSDQLKNIQSDWV